MNTKSNYLVIDSGKGALAILKLLPSAVTSTKNSWISGPDPDLICIMLI